MSGSRSGFETSISEVAILPITGLEKRSELLAGREGVVGSLFFFTPFERLELRAVKVFEVRLVCAGGMIGALVDPVIVSENFSAELGDGGVVFHKFRPGVDVIMVVIVLHIRGMTCSSIRN